MRILLLRPKPHSGSIRLQSFMLCEPLELEYVAAVLEQAEHTVAIRDLVLEKKNLRSILSNEDFQAVGMTANINDVGVVKEYAMQIKLIDKNIITFVCGVHAEREPKDFICENIDYIFHRNTIKELSAFFSQPLPASGTIIGLENDISLPIDNEYIPPYPDRSKTKQYRNHYNFLFAEKCASIKTAYNCLYKCELCIHTCDRPHMQRPVDDVVDELQQIEEKNILILDDGFLSDRSRILSFVDKLHQQKVSKKYIVRVRTDFIANNEDIIALLSKRGFVAFIIDLESYKEDELGDYVKRCNLENDIMAIKLLEKYGVQYYSSLYIGMDWKFEDFENLIKYIKAFAYPMVCFRPTAPIVDTPPIEQTDTQTIEKTDRYEFWDGSHLLLQPLNMSKRRFYYNLLRINLFVLASKDNRLYIKVRHGRDIYRRLRRGALRVAWQYIKLIIKP